MTFQQEISHDREVQSKAHRAVALTRLEQAVEHAGMVPGGHHLIGQAMCAYLDTMGGGAPEYDGYTDKRKEAALWAELATPMELELYVTVAVRAIGRATFAPRARKRLFNMLWRSFTKEEQAKFLEAASR